MYSVNLYTISCVAYVRRCRHVHPRPRHPQPLQPSCRPPQKNLARGNESGDRPSPTFRKSPNPSSTPSALSSKAALSLKPESEGRCHTGMWRPWGDPTRSSPHPQPKALPPTRPRTGPPSPHASSTRPRSSPPPGPCPPIADSSLGALLGLGGVSGNADMLLAG